VVRQVPLAGAVVALAVVGLPACGQGAKTSSGQLPPAQNENLQRIGRYIRALKKADAPFEHPQSEPTNYAKATQLSRTAVAEVSALTPPPQFHVAHEKLLTALRAEVAVEREFEAGQRAHNAGAINNAEAKNVHVVVAVRAALAEMATELERCKQDHWTCSGESSLPTTSSS
jgi:hypothetical protein